jgi:hypothetical protein
VTISSVQNLREKIHDLLEINDYKAVNTYLEHFIGAYDLREYISQSVTIENTLRDIREVINTHVTKAAKDIEVSESYVAMRQNLDLVQSITSHLLQYLNEANKNMTTKLEYQLHERIKQQYTDIIKDITDFQDGNFLVNEKYIVDRLSHNLALMAEVDKLFEDCTHYHSATEALTQVLTLHSAKFMEEFSRGLISADLRLSFRVLKEYNRAHTLAVHTSRELQGLYERAEKALLQQYVLLIFICSSSPP